jgi:hypothetical protein
MAGGMCVTSLSFPLKPSCGVGTPLLTSSLNHIFALAKFVSGQVVSKQLFVWKTLVGNAGAAFTALNLFHEVACVNWYCGSWYCIK